MGEAADGKQLFFRPSDQQGWLEATFALDKLHTLDLRARMTHSFDYGIYRVKLDGKDVATLDLYTPTITHHAHSLGVRALAKGSHTIRFECVGKSKASKGYYLGLDSLAALIPVYARDPSVDLRTLQKK